MALLHKEKKLESFFPVNILGNSLSPAKFAKNLGVTFDADFTFKKHVSTICSSCYYHIRDFSRIRKYLTKDTAVVLANALVSSRLDYCNSLLYGLPKAEIKRLQAVQNTLCRIVTRCSRFSHITPHMKALHWLPIASRIDFKTNLLTYKALNTGQPSYLKMYLNVYESRYNTRRAVPDNLALSTFDFNKKVHVSSRHLHNSYEYVAPKKWNNLPLRVRAAPSVMSFRSGLKRHLFCCAYDDP